MRMMEKMRPALFGVLGLTALAAGTMNMGCAQAAPHGARVKSSSSAGLPAASYTAEQADRGRKPTRKPARSAMARRWVVRLMRRH